MPMFDAQTTVAVVRCPAYAPEAVRQAVNDALGLLGVPKRFIRPGQRVLIKPASTNG